MTRPDIFRALIAVFYLAAGIAHFVYPAAFVGVMPAFVPSPYEVVIGTGVVEILGAAGLFIPPLRWWAGLALAAYAIFIFPANLQHAWSDIVAAGDYATLWYHAPRLPFQAVLVWWALYAGRVVTWPWRVARGATSA